MRSLLITLIAASLSVPAAAQEQTMEGQSINPEALRQEAMEQARLKNYNKALQLLSKARSIDPSNLDVALAQGYVFYWNGDIEKARKIVRQVSKLDPDYPELATLRSNVADTKTDKLTFQGATFGNSLSFIDFKNSDQQDTWNKTTAGLIAGNEVITLTGGIEHEVRASDDTSFYLDTVHDYRGWNMRLGATLTPDADFREDWSLSAGIDVPLDATFQFVSDLRFAQYGPKEVVTFRPGIETNLGKNTFLTARAILLDSDDANQKMGGSLRLDYRPENDNTYVFEVASYPDAEAGQVRQLRSITAGTSVPLTQDLRLYAFGSYESRDESYERGSVSISLLYRFNR